MRALTHSIIALVFIAGLTVSANAGDTKTAQTPETPKQLKNQTRCPVMGGKIDSTLYTDIQGQRVYHCCPMCSAKLKADPDTYFKTAAEAGILFEHIQTTCPVSGEKLKDKSVYVDYEGRRVVLCCAMCKDKFDADPAKYLKKLDEKDEGMPAHMEKMEKMKDCEQSGHNH
jgi:YHS domain-containing protein